LVKVDKNSNNIEITLTPNRSLSTKQTQWIVFAVCTFVFLVALFWSIQGAFLVLPFAGLDIILFAYFMFKINKESQRKQLITIDSQQVLIQAGITEVEKSLRLNRNDAYLVVNQEKEKLRGLKISDSKSYFEVGDFLTNSDKVLARQGFNQAGLHEVNEEWWKPL